MKREILEAEIKLLESLPITDKDHHYIGESYVCSSYIVDLLNQKRTELKSISNGFPVQIQRYITDWFTYKIVSDANELICALIDDLDASINWNSTQEISNEMYECGIRLVDDRGEVVPYGFWRV